MASQPQGRAKPKAPKAPKAKILQALRNVHTEQLAKLQQKYQFEQDLLEDIRSYSKQRSAIEKEYAQNLQKLNNNFIQKRECLSSKEKDITFKSPEAVWRTFLEESENVSKKRVEIAEGLQAQVADEVKTFKANKAQVFKKCSEMIQKVQEELFETIREMSKSKKNYMEAEKLAQVAGEQAAEAEDKYKKKNTKFFQSKATLGKNVTKSSSRKEVCEKRATMARNEYLLNLSASNAHVVQYYCTDLQRIMNSIYGDYYETIREYLLTMGKFEVDAAANAKNGFENLLAEAERVNKDYCVQCFLTKNNVFTEVIRYDYEPCRHDVVSNLSMDKNAGLALNKEARKLAMRVVREQKTIKEKQKALSGLKASDKQTSESPTTGDPYQEPEENPETIQEEIRKAELIKLKAEACLDLLKEAGVNVEEWLKSANSLSPMDQGLSSSQTSLDSENPTETAGWMDDEWDADDTFVGDYESDEDAQSITSTGSLPLPCIVLYNFEASTSDELNIAENEELEVLERDSDGWCKGRNKKGELGYFPESYVQFQSKKRPSLASNHSGSGQSGSVHSGSFTDGSLGASPGRTSYTAMAQPQDYICLVKALFDYEAVGDDEISFNEGDIIQVTRKDDNSVDDGFWEGCVDGRFGVFPSLVVEEIEGSEPQASFQQPQESTYSVPQITKTSNNKVDDYIELPKDYVPGGGSHSGTHTPAAVATPSPGNSPYLQPKRKAPPPPAGMSKKTHPTPHTNSLEPVDRRRVQTENISTMSKPNWGSLYDRSLSQEYPSVSGNTGNHGNRDGKTVYSACDHVSEQSSPGTGGTSPKPPKPPPPTKYKSKSYV